MKSENIYFEESNDLEEDQWRQNIKVNSNKPKMNFFYRNNKSHIAKLLVNLGENQNPNNINNINQENSNQYYGGSSSIFPSTTPKNFTFSYLNSCNSPNKEGNKKVNNHVSKNENKINNNEDIRLNYCLKFLGLDYLKFKLVKNNIKFEDIFYLSIKDMEKYKIPPSAQTILKKFTLEYLKIADVYTVDELINFFNTKKTKLIKKQSSLRSLTTDTNNSNNTHINNYKAKYMNNISNYTQTNGFEYINDKINMNNNNKVLKENDKKNINKNKKLKNYSEEKYITNNNSTKKNIYNNLTFRGSNPNRCNTFQIFEDSRCQYNIKINKYQSPSTIYSISVINKIEKDEKPNLRNSRKKNKSTNNYAIENMNYDINIPFTENNITDNNKISKQKSRENLNYFDNRSNFQNRLMKDLENLKENEDKSKNKKSKNKNSQNKVENKPIMKTKKDNNNNKLSEDMENVINNNNLNIITYNNRMIAKDNINSARFKNNNFFLENNNQKKNNSNFIYNSYREEKNKNSNIKQNISQKTKSLNRNILRFSNYTGNNNNIEQKIEDSSNQSDKDKINQLVLSTPSNPAKLYDYMNTKSNFDYRQNVDQLIGQAKIIPENTDANKIINLYKTKKRAYTEGSLNLEFLKMNNQNNKEFYDKESVLIEDILNESDKMEPIYDINNKRKKNNNNYMNNNMKNKERGKSAINKNISVYLGERIIKNQTGKKAQAYQNTTENKANKNVMNNYPQSNNNSINSNPNQNKFFEITNSNFINYNNTKSKKEFSKKKMIPYNIEVSYNYQLRDNNYLRQQFDNSTYNNDENQYNFMNNNLMKNYTNDSKKIINTYHSTPHYQKYKKKFMG